MRDSSQPSPYARFCDAIAVAHFIVAWLIIIVGALTPAFDWVGHKHSGLLFVYKYIDAPVYHFLKALDVAKGSDAVYTYLIATIIILLSSVLYWVIAMLFLKALFFFFDQD